MLKLIVTAKDGGPAPKEEAKEPEKKGKAQLSVVKSPGNGGGGGGGGGGGEPLPEKTKRLSKGQIESDYIQVLQGNIGISYNSKRDIAKWQKAPPFPYTYKVVKPQLHTAHPVILEIKKDNSCEIVTADKVAAKLQDWVEAASGCSRLFIDYNLGSKFLRTCVDAWMNRFQELDEMPKCIAMKSDPELTMNRLSFDPIHCTIHEIDEKAPVFAEMVSRIETNPQAFVQRIGSIFDFKAHRKQAIWLHGDSNAGKSIFQWMLTYLLGRENAATLSNLNKDSVKWFRDSLVGKRLALVPEAKPWFIRSGDFKDVTGDEHQHINPKYGKMYEARISSLFFFFSNDKPELPNDDALISRVINCKIKGLEKDKRKPEPEIKEALLKELPYILGFCIDEYNKIEKGVELPVDQEELKEFSEDYESNHIEFVDKFVEKVENDEDIPTECIVTPAELERKFCQWYPATHGPTSVERRMFKKFIEVHFDIKQGKKTITEGHKKRRVRVWYNIRWIKPIDYSGGSI